MRSPLAARRPLRRISIPLGRRKPTARRGATAVEMACVLPLLILLMLGATDFGRFGQRWIAVTNAARTGAGVGSTTPFTTASRATWESNIRQAVRAEMEGVRGFDPNRLTVAITTQTDTSSRQRVQVQVTYPFETLVTWAMIPAKVQLKQSATFPMVR